MSEGYEHSKKVLLFYVYEVLRRFSDADHQLSQGEIAELVQSLYGMTCDRKAVSRNIRALIEGGVDISTYVDNGRGCYLVGRHLTDVEISLLVDSVVDSDRLPARYVKELVARLSEMGTEYFTQRRVVLRKENAYTVNQEVPVNLEVLDMAIRTGKCVSFQENCYGIDLQLHPFSQTVMSPYIVFMSEGEYYVAGHDMQARTSRYWRVDRLTGIQPVGIPPIPVDSLPVEDIFHGADAQTLVEHMVGRTIKAVLYIPATLLDELIDCFGRELLVFSAEDGCLHVHVHDTEERVCRWILQHAGAVRVDSPNSLRRSVRRAAEALLVQCTD